MTSLRRLSLALLTRKSLQLALQKSAQRRALTQALKSTVLRQPQTYGTNLIKIKREIHFLPLLGLWGAKHVSMWTLYNTAKAYGWPRVYRRLLEQNRAMFAQQRKSGTVNANLQQSQLQSLIRLAIRSPPQLARQLSEKANVVMPYLHQLAERAEPAVPRFLVVAAKVILNSTKPIKMLQDALSAVPTSATKKVPK